MKRFFKKYGIWMLFVAVVAAVTLCVVSFFSNNSSPFTNLTNTVLAPFRSAFSSVVDWVDTQEKRFSDVKELEEELRALQLENEELRRQIRQAKTDSEENARLRKLLGLRAQEREYELESAKITARSSVNWESSLTLNRGTDQGVEAGDTVITEEGFLVGVVKEAGVNWCKVLTLLDTETSLGSVNFRTGETCVAKGDFHLMTENRLTAKYVEPTSEMMVGDLIVTSGLGGYYPAGLTVGSIESLHVDDSGLNYTAVLMPSVELGALTQVFIIKDFTVVD